MSMGIGAFLVSAIGYVVGAWAMWRAQRPGLLVAADLRQNTAAMQLLRSAVEELRGGLAVLRADDEDIVCGLNLLDGDLSALAARVTQATAHPQLEADVSGLIHRVCDLEDGHLRLLKSIHGDSSLSEPEGLICRVSDLERSVVFRASRDANDVNSMVDDEVALGLAVEDLGKRVHDLEDANRGGWWHAPGRFGAPAPWFPIDQITTGTNTITTAVGAVSPPSPCPPPSS